MLKIRIIPTLLLRNNRLVKGVNFDNYRDTGDPNYAARVYNSQYVDELIFLDIDATNEGRKTNVEIIKKVSEECFMPLAIGGGIKNSEDIRTLLNCGADKVVINTAAIDTPDLIKKASNEFGSQCIVVGIDVKLENNYYSVYKNSGKIKTNLDLVEYIKVLENLGAGEIFINSIDRDGTMKGYDLKLIELVMASTSLPVIASGGAGNFMHIVEAYNQTKVEAFAMASIYHFGDNNPIRARAYLKNNNIPIKIV